MLEPPAPGQWALAGHRMRMRLSQAIQARIPGQAGAVAAALMTGDRAGITESTNEAMRAANLAHIIAISGRITSYNVCYTKLLRYKRCFLQTAKARSK